VISAVVTTRQWPRGCESWRILLRDGRKHPSPNSGRPEAAMAGALGIQLGGVNYYNGQAQERPRMGDYTRALQLKDIDDATHIMVMAYGLGLAMAMAVLWLS
jgi:adenosylcobinamide-phosphate synthase